jgi:hypothetical protein
MLKGRRLDLLVFRLLTHVASAYLHKISGKVSGFFYSRKLERETESTAAKALQIPDADVVLPTHLGQPASVRSSNSQETYIITNPGTSDASCNCKHCKRGNPCKHLMKVSRLHNLNLSFCLRMYALILSCSALIKNPLCFAERCYEMCWHIVR